MKQTIKAKKGIFAGVIISLAFAIATIPVWLLLDENEPKDYLGFTAILPLFLIIWAFFSTKYAVDDKYLYYQSAFLKGKIDIASITEIEKNKTSWVGTKPALATGGLIIKQKYKEIYIAPENNDKLVEMLLKINPEIVVK